jgi:hypothetical protein
MSGWLIITWATVAGVAFAVVPGAGVFLRAQVVYLQKGVADCLAALQEDIVALRNDTVVTASMALRIVNTENHVPSSQALVEVSKSALAAGPHVLSSNVNSVVLRTAAAAAGLEDHEKLKPQLDRLGRLEASVHVSVAELNGEIRTLNYFMKRFPVAWYVARWGDMKPMSEVTYGEVYAKLNSTADLTAREERG